MRSTTRWVLAVCVLATLCRPALAQPDYTKWYLAEGSTGFFDEEILIANPNSTPAAVTIKYLLPAGVTAPAPKSMTLPPTSRTTVRVNQDVVHHAVSAVVTSNVPIVVERSMYWGGTNRLGGHNATGVVAPQMEWFLAEGVSNAIFDEFILLANPNDSAVDIQIDYLGTDGVKDVDTYTLAANSRRSVWAAVDLDGRFGGRFRSRTFSARVTSLTEGKPIIVERAIYWGGIFAAGLNPGGTAAAGLSSLSDTWHFGEGFTAGGFLTFVLIANPNEFDTTVDTTFFLEDGTTTTDTRVVPANSRTNIWVNAEVGRAGSHSFSILVKARDGANIAAERAMYWGGLREGHVVAGIPSEANAWGFAEGIEDRFGGVDYDTYFLLKNGGAGAVNVKATFLLEDGSGFQDSFPIGAQSRYTLIAARYPQLSNRRFAAFFEATGPIVAERAVYWGRGYYGGHASAGVPWSAAVGAPASAPPGPTVTSISPAAGPTTGGTEVTLVGTNFGLDASVSVGGIAAPHVRVVDAQTIAFTTPEHSVGPKNVVVTTRGETATNMPAFVYEQYVPPPPPGPPRTSDPPAGQLLPWPPPDMFWVVAEVAAQYPGALFNSCQEHGGNWEFMDRVVDRLRQYDARWGYNCKRGNCPDISQDVVAYHAGAGPEVNGVEQTYTVDIIGGHCGSRPSASWQPQGYVPGPGAARWHNRFRF